LAALPLSAQIGGKHMPHPVVHFEIGCRDRAKTEKFFSELFGWQIGAGSTIDGAGLPGHITSLGHEPEHYTMFYVEVDDVQAALDKATSLGGKTVVPPVKIPTGTFAWFADIDGNTIGLLKKG
jgi:predicted enzyme related to lactoylglutathione lyase